MPKIFIINTITAFLLATIISVAQEKIKIKRLSNNINTHGSEINFIQINDKEAYYTSVRKEDNSLYSAALYKTKNHSGIWNKGVYSKKYNLDVPNIANFTIEFEKKNIYLTLCNKDKKCKICIRKVSSKNITVIDNNKGPKKAVIFPERANKPKISPLFLKSTYLAIKDLLDA